MNLSSRDAAILALAMRETSTQNVDAFEPITKGPLFAAVALAFVLPLGALCMAWGILMRAGRRIFTAPRS